MPVIHALDLPEVVSRLVLYMDIQDLLACSAVSKSFRSSFGPFAWRDLHLGRPFSPENGPVPYHGFILIENKDESGPSIKTTTRLMEDIQDISLWIRSLSIHNHDSVFPSAIGASCRQLESIHLTALSVHDERHTGAHWSNCKKMFRQNRAHLKSLSLFKWEHMYHEFVKPDLGQPVWNPLLKCAQAWNLRSLVMVDCWIRGRYMKAFWTICERLEKLVMDNVLLHSTTPDVPINKRRAARLNQNNTSRAAPSQAMSSLSCQDSPSSTTIPFPRIKELWLRRLQRTSLPLLLNNIVRQCPALQSLYLEQEWREFYSLEQFCMLFAAGNWPKLDSIIIRGNVGWLTDAEHASLLRAAKRPLRLLDLGHHPIEEETLELYRTRHFTALERLDLLYYNGDTSDWAIQVLTYCPKLKWFRAKGIRAQDLLSGGEESQPWVCHGLEELSIFIDMGFKDNGVNRRFTDEELEQCRAIFKRLGTLKELRVLDLLSSYCNTSALTSKPYTSQGPPRHVLVPLPMRLKAGLDELSGLTKLKDVRFWVGRHAIFKKELVWMVEHWKQLKNVGGCWIIPNGVSTKNLYLVGGDMVIWLRERGITNFGSRADEDIDWRTARYSLEDCCGEE